MKRFIFFFLLFLVPLVNADVVSFSSSGSQEVALLSNSYIEGFFFGDVDREIIEDETPIPPIGGGGGGGGGITISEVAVPKFTLEPKLIEETIIVKEIEEGEIIITNEENVEKEFTLKVNILEEVIIFEDYKINIPAGETKRIKFEIHAPEKVGVYGGKIVVTTGSVSKEVLVALNIKIVKSLFDITVTIPKDMKSINQGENLQAQIDLTEMGLKDYKDVTLIYTIKDFSGRIYFTESETIAVADKKILSKKFFTEEFPIGDYILGVELIYPDGVAVASSYFRVDTLGVDKNEIIWIGLITLIIFIFILAIILFRVLIMDKKKKIKIKYKKLFKK